MKYLGHINTLNLARDLELVRSLVGYDEMDFWATDYASIVATTYAAMFPQRVGRIVLDDIIIGEKLADWQRHSISKTGWVFLETP